jgi:phenylacetate-CoA ligase
MAAPEEREGIHTRSGCSLKVRSVSSILETLYARMPAAAQHVACSIEGYRIQRSRYSERFTRLLAEYQQRSSWRSARIENFRSDRLRAFVQHARSARRYAGRPSIAAGVVDFELGELPILTKADVQAGIAATTAAVPGERTTMHHTSGSTGAGLRFPVTERAVQEQWAVWWRYRSWHGIPIDAWCGYFGGRSVVPVGRQMPPFWRFNWPGKQILFSGYHMSPETLDEYVQLLRRRRPPWLHGYPSLLSLISSHILESGQNLGYQVTWITTGAENLLPAQKSRIEAAFGVSPRQHYGQAEGVANISECPHGRLHVDEDFSYVEFIQSADDTYRIVGTNFTNPVFPLLRYDTGDLARMDGQECDCGRPGRIVSSIDGRREDCVVLPGGAVIGRLDHIFKDQVNIREAQVFQPTRSRIVFRVVAGPEFSAGDEQRLLADARMRLGKELDLAVDYVASVPRTASGKVRFVVSDVLQPADSFGSQI